jgi:ABC-type bacteriocin/lantibiotic exporter with double-glycine peptidase domain
VELQERKFSCGPAACRAALYVLGHNVTEAALRKYAGTTPEGTDEKGIMRAINHYGHRTKEFQAESLKHSWSWLKKALGQGKPVLLCVDQWDHWIAAVGRLGGKIIIFDPDSSQGRKKYSGLKVYNEHDLGKRWKFTETTGSSSYYAISITK